MSDIPRTNAAVTIALAEQVVGAIVAECAKLERELTAACAEIARLNGQTRWQCACGGTDCAGQKENETLRADVSQLRAALELGQINCDAVYSDMQLDRERVMDELTTEREKVRKLRAACASAIREYSVSELREALSATEDKT